MKNLSAIDEAKDLITKEWLESSSNNLALQAKTLHVGGNASLDGETLADSIIAGSLLVNGDARFVNTIQGNIESASKVANALTFTGFQSKTFNGSSAVTVDIPDALSDLTADATHRLVTDTQIAAWNAKWDYNENTIKGVKVNNAWNADTLGGFGASDIGRAGWYTFGGSTYSGILWTKIASISASRGDNIENDMLFELSVYGDQNYTSHIHGYLRCTAYGPTSTSIVLSTDPKIGGQEDIQLYATIDSDRNIWIGRKTYYTCRSLFRVLVKGVENTIYYSNFATTRTAPNEKYISFNGAYKYGGNIAPLSLPNVTATNAEQLGGVTAGSYLQKSGGTMTGSIILPGSVAIGSSGLPISTGTSLLYHDNADTYIGPLTGMTFIRSGNAGLRHRKAGTDYLIYDASNSNRSDVAWTASSLTLNGALSGATTGAFSSDVTVGGSLTLANAKDFNFKNTPGTALSVLRLDANNNLSLGLGTSSSGYNTYLNGNTIIFRYGTSYTEGMRLTGGKLGIGTTSPSGKLDVRNNAPNLLELHRTDTLGGAFVDYYAMNQTATFWRVGSDGNHRFIWNTSGITRMTLSTDGKLYLDGSENDTNAPHITYDATNHAFHIAGNLYADGFISAGGISSTTSGGGLDWTELTTQGTQVIHASHIPSLDISKIGNLASASVAYATNASQLGGLAASSYATQTWVNNQGFLKTHQSLAGYATQSWVEGKGYQLASTAITTSNISSQNVNTATILYGYVIPYNRPVANGGNEKQWVRICLFEDTTIDNGNKWYGYSAMGEITSGGYSSQGMMYLGRLGLGVTVKNEGTLVNAEVRVYWLDINRYYNTTAKAVVTKTTVEFFVLNNYWDTTLTWRTMHRSGLAISPAALYTPTEFESYCKDKKTINASSQIFVQVGASSLADTLATSRTIWGQSFDGSGNVSGHMSSVGNITHINTSTWSDGTNEHPWYGIGFNHNTGVNSTTISNYFGLRFHTGSGDMVLTTGGCVGVNITSPSYNFDVNGSFNATSGYINGNGIIHSGNIGNQSVSYATTAGTASYANHPNIVAGDEIRFGNKPSSAIDLHFGWAWADGTKAALISSYRFDDGNGSLTKIAAADAAFTNNVEVDGTIVLGGDIQMNGDGTSPYRLTNTQQPFIRAWRTDWSNKAALEYVPAYSALCFTSGNVGIGTTSPSAKLHVAGDAMFDSVSVRMGTWGARMSYYWNNANAARWDVYCSNSAVFTWDATNDNASAWLGTRMSLDRSGNLTAAGEVTAYSSSDIRLKTDIHDFKALDTLKSLGGYKAYRFNGVDGTEDTETMRYGLMYQNVVKSEFGSLMAYERENGYGALNYVKADYINLIGASVLEVEDEVTILKKEVATLKAKIKELEAR